MTTTTTRGRPRKKPAKRLRRAVSVNLTDAEHRAVLNAASDHGISASALARRALAALVPEIATA